MGNNKKFDASDFSNFFNKDTENNSIDFMWMFLIVFLIFGFFPNSNSSETFLKGKIEAYENVLKGFDSNDR